MDHVRDREHSTLSPTSSSVPLAYFVLAHISLAVAAVMLVWQPEVASGSFYQPKMIALTHLLTLGWISGSILGAFYIVAPLALGAPMPASRGDWAAFAAFLVGMVGMVAHFWLATYDGMAWSAALLLGAIAFVGARAHRALAHAGVSSAIALHVRLAFLNILAAGAFGIVIGIDRTRGILGLPPVAATFAHAHLAALGWAVMMVMGLSYRLVPLLLPAAVPRGGRLAASAILLEAGLIVLAVSLVTGQTFVPLGAFLIAAALVVFFTRMARIVSTRVSRPLTKRRRDWSISQVHAAFFWLVAAAVLGLVLASSSFLNGRTHVAWAYGVAGLVGFLAQIIAGMHARLVPHYAWHRARVRGDGTPPAVNVYALISSRHARATYVTWLAAVPLLACGLASGTSLLLRLGALLLLAGVATGGAHFMSMFRVAHKSVVRAPSGTAPWPTHIHP